MDMFLLAESCVRWRRRASRRTPLDDKAENVTPPYCGGLDGGQGAPGRSPPREAAPHGPGAAPGRGGWSNRFVTTPAPTAVKIAAANHFPLEPYQSVRTS